MTAEEQKPTVTIKLKDGTGTALTAGTDFDVTYPVDSTNAGEKKVAIAFKGNYAGASVEKDYRIEPKPLTTSDVTITNGALTYTGSAQGPNIVVKDGDATLTEGKDYLVADGTATAVKVGPFGGVGANKQPNSGQQPACVLQSQICACTIIALQCLRKIFPQVNCVWCMPRACWAHGATVSAGDS